MQTKHYILLFLGFVFQMTQQPIFAQDIHCQTLEWHTPNIYELENSTYKLLSDSLEIKVNYACTPNQVLSAKDFTVYIDDNPTPTGKARINSIVKMHSYKMILHPPAGTHTIQIGIGNKKTTPLIVTSNEIEKTPSSTVKPSLIGIKPLEWHTPNVFELENNTYRLLEDSLDIVLNYNAPHTLNPQDFDIYINDTLLSPSKIGFSSVKRNTYQARIAFRNGATHKLEVGMGDKRSTPLNIQYSIKPNLHIFSVGVSSDDLKFTQKDAEDIANMLKAQGNFSLFENVYSTLLVNGDASKSTILAKLQELKDNSDIHEWDFMVFFFSSHGDLDEKGNFYLKCNLFKSSNEMRPLTTINTEELTKALSLIPCQKLVLIDACHSGAFEGAKMRDLTRKIILDDAPGAHSMNVIAAASKNEEAIEDTKSQNGAFTATILRAISGAADKNKNHIITYEEFTKYLATNDTLFGGETNGKVAPKPVITRSEMEGKTALFYVTESAEELFKQAEIAFKQGTDSSYKTAISYYIAASEMNYAPAKAKLKAWNIENSKDLVTLYFKASEENDKVAQFELGKLYNGGKRLLLNKESATNWYEKSAKQGYADGQGELCRAYYNGEGKTKSMDKALEWAEKAANQGNAAGQNILGIFYETKKDYKTAVEWFKKAASQGYDKALMRLARLYREGKGVEKNEKEAAKLIEMAANQGNPDAQFVIGICYQKGEGVNKDTQKAEEWLLKSANNGHEGAQWYLGNAHESIAKTLKGIADFMVSQEEAIEKLKRIPGKGELNSLTSMETYLMKTRKSYDSLSRSWESFEQACANAFYWHSKAANQGGISSQLFLAKYYTGEFNGVKDNKEAIKWLQKLANRNNVDAMWLLGEWYSKGIVVEKDFEMALQCYEKAARLSEEWQKINKYSEIADFYQKGQQLPLDFVKAFEWYKKAESLSLAFDLKNVDSITLLWAKGCFGIIHAALAQAYLDGKGVQVDYIKALEHCEKAESYGNEGSRFIASIIIGGEHTSDEIRKNYCEKKAKQGDAYYQYQLGLIFEEENSQDCSKAIEMYEKAAKQSYRNAINALARLYHEGKCIKGDEKKALQYNLDALKIDQKEYGEAKGLYILADKYEAGKTIAKDSVKACEYYLKAADLGHKESQTKMGYYFYKGKYISKDDEKSMAYYEKAIRQGDAEDAYDLAQRFMFGVSIKQSDKKSSEWFQIAIEGFLKRAEETNDDNAEWYLGRTYYKGYGVTKDYKKAVEWFEKSANQGNTMSLCKLGICLRKGGYGISQNPEKAIKLFHQAYEIACKNFESDKNALKEFKSEPALELGRCYKNGEGIEQNFHEAFKWFQIASEGRKGQYELGLCYYDGRGTEKNDEKAFECFRMASKANSDYFENGEKDVAGIQYMLGRMYEKGEGTAKDYEKAFAYYKKAIRQDLAEAQYALALCYYEGKGTQKDKSKTFEWCEKAAEQGLPIAQFKLYEFYAHGDCAPKDAKLAFKWCEKAAKQGMKEAQNEVGEMYENANGVNEDYPKAIQWYEKSARQGFAPAQYNLALLYYNGKKVAQDYERALEWFEKAANQGDAEAQYMFALMYENGNGTSPNQAKAIEYYRLAAKQGQAKAQKALKRLGYKE